MTSAAVISLICGLLWACLFYFAIRHRDWWSVLVVMLAWAVNVFLGAGLIFEGNVTRIMSTGLVAVLLVDRLMQNPAHVQRVAAKQLVDTRRELHDCQADRASWEARAVAYRRMLDEHGIHS